MLDIINDPYFEVKVCPFGSSPNPEMSIWDGQHFCVTDGEEEFNYPDSQKDAGEAVINKQLNVEHWSVLDQAFLKFRIFGFPHTVISQMTRHHESFPLVQSGRYTGNRFKKFEECESEEEERELIEKTLYFRPSGRYYRNRKGVRYFYFKEERDEDIEKAKDSFREFVKRINDGQPYEMARSRFQYDFRQHFCFSGTIRKTFHWLDQRSKKDAQLESQTLAYMALEKAKEWSPTFFNFYEETRFGKARLAP